MKRKPEEADCYFNRAQDAIDDAGGRYALPEPRRRIVGRDAYPEVSPTPLTSPQPDHQFSPERDRVDEPTSMKYGQDLRRLPGAPPLEANSVPSPPIERSEASSFRRRF